jgi:ribonuclease D
MLDEPTIFVHENDLPADISFGSSVAIDTETTGLSLTRDRLCLVQLCGGDNVCHLVRIPQRDVLGTVPEAPNLARLLADKSVTKLFHFGRFDIAVLYARFSVLCEPVFCSKIASRLVRTYTDRHSLKVLIQELLHLDISKEQQSSDWGADILTDEQLHYAAGDVLYLHRIRTILEERLDREGRLDLARSCWAFLPERARLDVAGWPDEDIFAY